MKRSVSSNIEDQNAKIALSLSFKTIWLTVPSSNKDKETAAPPANGSIMVTVKAKIKTIAPIKTKIHKKQILVTIEGISGQSIVIPSNVAQTGILGGSDAKVPPCLPEHSSICFITVFSFPFPPGYRKGE